MCVISIMLILCCWCGVCGGGFKADVVTDAMIIERTEGKSQTVSAKLQSFAWSSTTIGSTTGSLTFYFLLADESIEIRNIFRWLSVFPLIYCVILWFVDERKHPMVETWTGIWGKLRELWTTMLRREILMPVLFMFFLSKSVFIYIYIKIFRKTI